MRKVTRKTFLRGQSIENLEAGVMSMKTVLLKNFFMLVFTVILVTSSIVPVVSEVSSERGSEPVGLNVVLRGFRWVGSSGRVLIIVKIGEEVAHTQLEVQKGSVIEATLSFENISVPTSFSIELLDLNSVACLLDGEVQMASLKISRILCDERRVVGYGNVLIEFNFIGRFYTIEVELPVIVPDVLVEASVDGTLVQAEVSQQAGSIKIVVKDVILTGEVSKFDIIVKTPNLTIAIVSGYVTRHGLREIALVGGILEKLSARSYVTTGTRKAVVPTSILNTRFAAEEALQVVKMTEVVVRSTEIIHGNVPVKLVAMRRGSILREAEIIPHALFEVTLLSLNVTRVYRCNETAYLPEGERVHIKVTADGYVPVEEVFVVSYETSELVFYLEEAEPSPVSTLENLFEKIVTHRLFLPIIMGIVTGLLIAALLRRG